MQDFETGSLWAQVLGECIRGEYEGRKLTLFASQHMAFEEFATQYPHGRLLAKPGKGPARSGYSDYFNDPGRLGIFGRANTFHRLSAKELVYGLRLGDEQVAIPVSRLTASGLIVANVTRPAVVVVYDKVSHTASAFQLPSDVSEVSVTKEGSLESATGTTWHPVTGRNLSGGAADLKVLPLLSAYWFAWVTFYPDTHLIE